MSTSVPHRRVLVAIGAVAAPVLLDLGNLIAPQSDGTAAQQLAAIHTHESAYWGGQLMVVAGFLLLGALGAAVAMLVRRRAAVLATIGALLTITGGAIMAGAVLVGAVVDDVIPASKAEVLTLLQSSPEVGVLFDAAAVAGIGGLLGSVALLIARPAGLVAPILLIVGLLLSFVGGGPLSVLLSLPTIVAAVLIARALLRAPASVTTGVTRESVPA